MSNVISLDAERIARRGHGETTSRDPAAEADRQLTRLLLHLRRQLFLTPEEAEPYLYEIHHLLDHLRVDRQEVSR